jgi:RING-variant domain
MHSEPVLATLLVHTCATLSTITITSEEIGSLMSNPTFESPLFVDLKSDGAQMDALVAVDNEAGVKCCRICLEDEDQDSMIAPCLCKGSMKWVHRSCLDEWRRNEQDRAFSQCTECHFQYHFIEKDSPKSFWNQPRTKLFLFISRDIFVVTLLLQCLIGLFGLITMLLDRSQHWNLTHIFDTSESPYSACRNDSGNSRYNYYESTGGAATNVLNATLTYCHHHALAMYYLFGLMALLVSVGLVGTSIFCCNGCRMPPLGDRGDAQISGYESLNDREATKASMERGDTPTTEDTVNQNYTSERRALYYREQRRRRQSHSDHCCLCCSSPNYYYRTPNDCCFIYDGVSTGSDCCCCCCDNAASDSECCCNGPHHNVSSNDCSCDGDAPAVMFFVLLLFLIVMAVIGLFMVLFVGVVICQRIVQRHMFRLQKKQLVHEFQVADLSSSNTMQDVPDGDGTTRTPSSYSTLRPNDLIRLKKLGLIAPDG